MESAHATEADKPLEVKGLSDMVRRFSTDAACRGYLESRRWPDGPVCPHCGFKGAYRIAGEKARPGLWTCKSPVCRKQYTVTVGTIFRDSHLPLPVWFQIIYLMCASKKGVSAHQLHRMLEIPYKTAWSVCQRLRLEMRAKTELFHLRDVVEIDETFLGGRPRPRHGLTRKVDGRRRKMENKTVVMAMVERGGRVLARPIRGTKRGNLSPMIARHVDPKAAVMTDHWGAYKTILAGREHHTVNHANRQYADGAAHVNTAESFFALLKRGYHGTFHHFSRKWAGRYCAEFGFRFNTRQLTDGQRFGAFFADLTTIGWAWGHPRRPAQA